MKSRTLKFAVGILLLAELATPFCLTAQQPRYRLIDIPTLGGDKAYGQGNGPGTSQFLGSAGTVIGTSDTTVPDPKCGNPDCLVAHAFRWQDGVLTDLGTLPGGNSSDSSAINARGWIAGGANTSVLDPLTGSPAEHAVLWKEDNEIVDLGTLPGGIESATLYVKNGGEVVGIATVDTVIDPFASIGQGPFPSPTHAFIWKNGVMRDLGTLGGPDSFALGGCNNNRTDLVSGSSFTSSTPNPNSGFPTLDPFLWENGTMTDLGSLGGTLGFAQCSNNNGQVIGQSNLTGDSEQHAFFWDHGTLTNLGTLGGTFSIAFWLNDVGEAVGFATTSGDAEAHATLWKNGVITDLGTLDGDCFSQALAINSHGQIVGESFNCDTNTLRAVLWDKGVIIELDATVPPSSSLQLRETFNINDRGEIVGEGFPVGCNDVNFCGHSFLLIPCDQASNGGCGGNDSASVRVGPKTITTTASTAAQRRNMTKEFVAQARARLDQRSHTLGLGALRK
jgi:probable HAF family extracellular repeat protein